MAIIKSKRAVALFLALFAFILFCCGPLAKNAEAVVLVDDAFLAVVIAALAAFGIVFTSTGGFSSIQGFVNDVINQYAESTGVSVSSLLNGIQTGSNSLGQILLNNRYVVFLQGLAAFITVSYSLGNNERKQLVSSSSSVGGVRLYDLPQFIQYRDTPEGYRFEIYYGTDVFMMLEEASNSTPQSRRAMPYFLSNYEGNQVQRFYVDANGMVGTGNILPLVDHVSGKTLYGYTGGVVFGLEAYGLEDANVYPAGTYNDLLNSNLTIVAGGSYDLYVETGTIELPYQNPEYDQGDGGILDVLAAWGMTYDTITYRVIPGTYEDATITYDSEAVVQEQVTDTPQTNVSTEAGDYTVSGLQSVFPFCIPFDIYAFFGCLAADPVAPVINWRFYIPGICDETITIDLSVYDSVAQVLRTMELLAFIIGLAFVTREKFLRG